MLWYHVVCITRCVGRPAHGHLAVRSVIVSTPSASEQISPQPSGRSGIWIDAAVVLQCRCIAATAAVLVSPTCDICVSGPCPPWTACCRCRALRFSPVYLVAARAGGGYPQPRQVQERLPTTTVETLLGSRPQAVPGISSTVAVGTTPQPHHIAWTFFSSMAQAPCGTRSRRCGILEAPLFLEDVPELDAAVLKRRLERSLRATRTTRTPT